MAFGLKTLRIATLVFLFIASYRFLASDSLTDVLRKRYGLDSVKEIRALEKLDFKYKKVNLDLDFLISSTKIIFFPTLLQFKVSNEQLRASKAYISYQKKFQFEHFHSSFSQVDIFHSKECFVHIFSSFSRYFALF